MSATLFATAAATISCASCALTANGFSHKTGLPALSAAITFSLCAGCGVATYIASILSSATSSS